MRKPLIGITAYYMKDKLNDPKGFVVVRPQYANAILQAGGIPVHLPLDQSEADLRALFDQLDGLLFSGGGDIDPALFNSPGHDTVYGIDPARDAQELALARWAVAEGKPVLAICRGAQILNVALGGTLILDIPSQFPDALLHKAYPPEHDRTHSAHPVTLAPDSKLAHTLGQTELGVNSLHHQSCGEIAPGLRAVGHAPDGIVEALELIDPAHPFCLAVQWHPEWLTARPETQRLFTGFVAACTTLANGQPHPTPA